jgi:predicted nucleic acid-binding protein
MSLVDLRDGDRVFIDANIFIYHFGGRSLECKALLERCARRALLGYTSTPILAEVLHRRMVAEAIARVRQRPNGREEAWGNPRNGQTTHPVSRRCE